MLKLVSPRPVKACPFFVGNTQLHCRKRNTAELVSDFRTWPSTTMIKMVKSSVLVDSEAPVLATYIDDVAWGCGFTRNFDSEVSLAKKAKDITKHLSDAVKQLPADRPAIIHIAAETMEGSDVEVLRTERFFSTIKDFIMD